MKGLFLLLLLVLLIVSSCSSPVTGAEQEEKDVTVGDVLSAKEFLSLLERGKIENFSIVVVRGTITHMEEVGWEQSKPRLQVYFGEIEVFFPPNRECPNFERLESLQIGEEIVIRGEAIEFTPRIINTELID